ASLSLSANSVKNYCCSSFTVKKGEYSRTALPAAFQPAVRRVVRMVNSGNLLTGNPLLCKMLCLAQQ
ncbi:MAG: hypothetical protein U0K35_03185, partial [Prevotella sp.]|nr:hypothetical protein [Prevotella sp.]